MPSVAAKACPSAIACAQYRKIRHVRPGRQFDNQTREGKGAERLNGYVKHRSGHFLKINTP
jgi:hypothetical protein